MSEWSEIWSRGCYIQIDWNGLQSCRRPRQTPEPKTSWKCSWTFSTQTSTTPTKLPPLWRPPTKAETLSSLSWWETVVSVSFWQTSGSHTHVIANWETNFLGHEALHDFQKSRRILFALLAKFVKTDNLHKWFHTLVRQLLEPNSCDLTSR